MKVEKFNNIYQVEFNFNMIWDTRYPGIKNTTINIVW